MANFIIVVVLAAIIGLSIAYIVKEKKRGVRCIGCPDGGSCSGCHGCSGAGSCSCSCGE